MKIRSKRRFVSKIAAVIATLLIVLNITPLAAFASINSWQGDTWRGDSWNGASWEGVKWEGSSWQSGTWNEGGCELHPVKETLKFYIGNIEKILLLSVTIVLPLLVLHNLTVNYIYLVTSFSGSTAFGDTANGFFMLLFLLIAQLPFIQLVRSDMDGEESPVKQAL